MTTTKPKAAAAARIGTALAARKRGELLALLRPCFSRVEPWLQAGKYVAAVASDVPWRNGWTIAQRAGDRSPQRTQRLLGRAVWDTFAAMGVVRGFAVAGLEEAARRSGRRRGLRVGAIDGTSQVKQGSATAGVKRHYLGCVGKVANGITTVHLSYVRERTGHALIGARQWIAAEQISDPVTPLVVGLPDGLQFRTKGQLAIDILTETLTGGVSQVRRRHPGDHRRVLPADHQPTASARLPLTCLSMGLNMFVQGFDAGDAAPMPSSAFDVFRPHVVLVRPEHHFWRVRTPDGDEADIYADATPETFGSLMISHFAVGGPLDLLAEFAIRASAVILTPGGPAMLTAKTQRQHLPDKFQHAAIVIRNGDDIRQAIATF